MRPFAKVADLRPDTVSLRRALFLATGAGITAGGTVLMFSIFQSGGISLLEGALLALFVPLFGQIAFGFAIAFWGFVILAIGGDRFDIMRTLRADEPGAAPGSTAIALPIFNEDPDRTFRGLENMFRSLEATGAGTSFDFFVLSDSNDPDRWIEEETAWFRLCSRCQAFGRIFYRKRRVSLHGKSGNIADFCRRWGGRYQYLLILDADSVMSGETIVRLARVMDANPEVGIVQTGPKIVRGTSILQRFVQYATRSVGPLFAAGSNFWHLGGGNYWGHNAMLRLKPFIEQCVLPELPGRSPADRHILSHDTVEASLMQQAGYQVWFAYLETGSYEEGPPNLTESLKRDRRWCQGNLQHFWFLLAPGTRFTNRIHIFFGLMAYLTAPMLVAFIILSSWESYRRQVFEVFSGSIDNPAPIAWAPAALLAITVVLLFVPKLLGFLHLAPRAREFGGVLRVLASTLLETLLSVLIAPILLFFYTKFVVLTALGLRVTWKTQNRDAAGIPLSDAIRTYAAPNAIGLAAAAVVYFQMPGLLLWLSPVLAGLVLAIPIAMLTSSESLGLALRKWGLLLIPEESSTPEILQNLDAQPNDPTLTPRGIFQVAISPEAQAIHASLLRRSRVHARHKIDYLAALRQRLLSDGPPSLTRRELTALLWDPHAVEQLHRDIWLLPDQDLHPAWQHALRHFNERSELTNRRDIAQTGISRPAAATPNPQRGRL